ncbi:MAG TPA: hypothetical protein DEB39_00220 [Planctomycetaceae bacterium]|nr:hypothetical protein [Planctomycetaceae bacterium]
MLVYRKRPEAVPRTIACRSNDSRKYLHLQKLWQASAAGRLDQMSVFIAFPVYSAIGRKNRQFYGSANGGKTGAVLHSILASAHRHGLNEYEYFLDVIDTLCDLPSQAAIGDLLPDRWKPTSAR